MKSVKNKIKYELIIKADVRLHPRNRDEKEKVFWNEAERMSNEVKRALGLPNCNRAIRDHIKHEISKK